MPRAPKGRDIAKQPAHSNTAHGSKSSKKVAPPPARAPRLAAANMAGITMLMNSQNIKAGVNLDAAEKSVMGKTPGRQSATIDPVKLYAKEMDQLAEELGIDLQDGGGDAPEKPSATTATVKTIAPRSVDVPELEKLLTDDFDLGLPPPKKRRNDASSRTSRPSGSVRGGSRSPAKSEDGSEYTDASDEGDEGDYTDASGEGDDDGSEYTDASGEGDDGSEYTDASDEGDEDDIDADNVLAELEDELGIRTDGSREKRRNKLRPTEIPAKPDREKRETLTEEQTNRLHVNSVFGDLRKEATTSFGAESARVEDLKANKLEQIGQLRAALEEEGIDTKSIENPSADSPMEKIEGVLHILRLKNDRNRYSSLAEEVIIGVAEGAESVFDGSRTIPVLGWKPDYTGYSNTVNCKLHRMRFETAQIVGNIIEKYQIGPAARIVLELLPSFFLFPRQNRKQRGSPGLHNDPRISPQVSDPRSAYAAIRASEVGNGMDADALARV